MRFASKAFVLQKFPPVSPPSPIYIPSNVVSPRPCRSVRFARLLNLHHERQTTYPFEKKVFEQEQELQKLRVEVSRSRRKSGERGGGREEGGGRAGAPPEQRGGGVSLAGVFRWWRQHDRTQAVPDRRRGVRGGGGGNGTGAVTVV